MENLMAILSIRKIVVQLEEIHREGGREVTSPTLKVVAGSVIDNPFAGRYIEDLEPLYDLGAEISRILSERAIAGLNVPADSVQSYGKGAIVGINGEIEHAAALLHPRFGAPVRKAIGKGDDIIPSTKKIGGPGSTIVMPVTHKDNIWDFDHMDAAELTIADAPKPDEIVVAVVLGVGGRPLKRTRADK
jgi:hypothetical protein